MARFPASFLSLVAVALAPVHGQNTTVLIDFGDSTQLSAGGAPAWNDVHPGNVASSQALVDDAGAASGIQLDFTPGLTSTTSVNQGVLSPTPGSPLALLGWPGTATRDALYGDSGRPRMEFTLTGLDATASYDFTLTASRLNVTDQRTTEYSIFGFNTGAATLDPSNNFTETVSIVGIVPDASQAIRISVEADFSNTNTSGFYYLSALSFTETPGGGQGSLLAFASPSLAISRKEGLGTFQTTLDVITNDGSMPGLTLSAVDDATGMAPTWLTMPATGTVGTPIALQVDGSGLPLGTESATVTASAAGYASVDTSVSLTLRDANGPRNLLFYGNSFTQGNGTVSTLVGTMAAEAGQPAPNVVARLVGGQNLFYHLTNPVQAAAITQALPLGEEWDWVVMQGHSQEATNTLGDPAAFIANAEAIFANVRSHSPAARACLFQTWAYAPGNGVYPSAFPNPLAMHRQIETNYALAVANIDALHGAGSAVRAAAGETSALSGFPLRLYTSDLVHPSAQLTVMTSAAILRRLFLERACDLDPDFGGGSPLAAYLSGNDIGLALWNELAGISDRVAPPGMREFPGSSDDLLLRSGTGGQSDPCPSGSMQAGGTLNLRLESPIGLAQSAAWGLYVNFGPYARGANGHPVFPEIYFDLANPSALVTGAELPGGGVSFDWSVPAQLGGTWVLVQGFAATPSSKTGNAFMTTDAHDWTLSGGPQVRRVLGAVR